MSNANEACKIIRIDTPTPRKREDRTSSSTDVGTKKQIDFDMTVDIGPAPDVVGPIPDAVTGGESLDEAMPSVRAAILGKGNRMDVEFRDQGEKRAADTTMRDIDPAGFVPAVAETFVNDGDKPAGDNEGDMHIDSVNAELDAQGQRGSDCGVLAFTDEAAKSPLNVKTQRPGPKPKPQWKKDRPEQQVKSDQIHKDECAWKPIGSGMFARTFKGAPSLLTTTKSGPCEADVYRRVVRDVETGRVIHDCITDDTADDELKMQLEEPRDIRVELVMKDAAKWYKVTNHDVI